MSEPKLFKWNSSDFSIGCIYGDGEIPLENDYNYCEHCILKNTMFNPYDGTPPKDNQYWVWWEQEILSAREDTKKRLYCNEVYEPMVQTTRSEISDIESINSDSDIDNEEEGTYTIEYYKEPVIVSRNGGKERSILSQLIKMRSQSKYYC